MRIFFFYQVLSVLMILLGKVICPSEQNVAYQTDLLLVTQFPFKVLIKSGERLMHKAQYALAKIA